MVTAQLKEPKKDKHIWQNEYDRPYKDIIEIQADIAIQIANHLKAFLTVFEKQNIQKVPTINQEAYQLLRQALHLWNTRSFTSVDQLLELTNRAIGLDPEYADAYAFSGIMTIAKGTILGNSEMQYVGWNAASNFDRALELDQNCQAAHLGLALLNDYAKWDYIKAEKEFLKAIELAPNSPASMERYIEFLLKRSRIEDVQEYIENPKISLYEQTRARVLLGVLSGNGNAILDLINTYLKAGGEKVQKDAGEFYAWLGEFEAARLSLEAAMQTKDYNMLTPKFQACLALSINKTEDDLKAKMIINELIEKNNKTSAGSPEYFIGWYFSGIGNVDSAFYWLEEAFKKRSPEMPWLKVDPVFNNLKNDDRYWNLYDRTGHKAYDDYRTSSTK